jgi:hypothetical protein
MKAAQKQEPDELNSTPRHEATQEGAWKGTDSASRWQETTPSGCCRKRDRSTPNPFSSPGWLADKISCSVGSYSILNLLHNLHMRALLLIKHPFISFFLDIPPKVKDDSCINPLLTLWWNPGNRRNPVSNTTLLERNYICVHLQIKSDPIPYSLCKVTFHKQVVVRLW